RHWAPMMAAEPRPPKDAKTALQEWAQGRGLGLPHYEVVASVGPDHSPSFSVRVHVEGAPEATATATAGSKRSAEQAAAEAWLAILHERDHGRRWAQPLRLRRPGGRAQCRKVDASERANRGQAVDRDAQGADHAHPHPGRCDRGSSAD